MYESFLFIHSWNRWAVVLAVVYFFIRSARAWLKVQPWSAADTYFIWAFSQAITYQAVFGFALWLSLSPITKAGFKAPSDIFGNPVIFFWTVRHGLTMLIALTVFWTARARARQVPSPTLFKFYTVTFALLLLLIGSAIPWPGLAYGRALFRWSF